MSRVVQVPRIARNKGSLMYFIYLLFIHVQPFRMIKINTHREKGKNKITSTILRFAAPPKGLCSGLVGSEVIF